MKKIALAVVAVATMLAPSPVRAAEQPVDAFLRMYNSLFKGITTVANEAAWLASTDVSDAHEAGRTVGNTALAAIAASSKRRAPSCRIDATCRPSCPVSSTRSCWRRPKVRGPFPR
jgi:hypothetical protein